MDPINLEGEVTVLLRRVAAGDKPAEEALLSLVHFQLHRIAAARMRREAAGHTLQPTDLLHEAWKKLCSGQAIEFQDRAHFFRVASKVMKNVLLDWARRKASEKHGGRVSFVADGYAGIPVASKDLNMILDVQNLLVRLRRLSPRQAKVVELRFYAGLEEDEIAEVLSVGTRTVRRDWKLARAWLHQQLETGKARAACR